MAHTSYTSYHLAFAHSTPATFCFSPRKLLPAFVLLRPSAWKIISLFHLSGCPLPFGSQKPTFLPISVATESFIFLVLVLCLVYCELTLFLFIPCFCLCQSPPNLSSTSAYRHPYVSVLIPSKRARHKGVQKVFVEIMKSRRSKTFAAQR